MAEAMRNPTAAAAPLRPVRLGPSDVELERRADGTLYLRSPHPLERYPDKLTARLEHWAAVAPDRVFLAQRTRDGAWRKLALPRRLASGAQHRPGAHRPEAVGGASHRDPVRQRHRARAARARRHDGRRALCADLGALFADVERLRQAQVDHRGAHARPGVRHRRQAVCARDRQRGAARHRDRHHLESARQPADHVLRRVADDRVDRGGRGLSRQGHAGHDRQDPVHLGLDRLPEGRDQHPAHAVLEPGDGARRIVLRRRRAAGDRGLAAVEPHLRQQPQLQHGARQRRLALHRRRQAAARRDRGHGEEPQGDRADHLLQRAEGLRGAGAASSRRRRSAEELLQPVEGAVLRRRGSAAICPGRAAGAERFDLAASG